MRVIIPITVDNSILISSTINEPEIGVDPLVWSTTTPYVSGDRAILVSTHVVYECIVNVTGGDPPNISVTRAIPKWIEVGATNKWAMFDLYRSTPTVSTTTELKVILLGTATANTGQGIGYIEYLYSAPIATAPISTVPIGTDMNNYSSIIASTYGYIGPDSVALLDLVNVSSINIKAISTADLVVRHDVTYDLSGRNTISWWTYFFPTASTRQTDLVVFDMPIRTYGELLIEITLTGSIGMTIGSCILGTNAILGNIYRGSVIDALNFSSIDRDSFGNAYMVQRRNIPKTTQRIFIDKSNLNELIEIRKSLVAKPALWVGTEDINDPYFTSLLVLGFYTDFSFNIDNPIGSLLTLELEEL